MCQGVAIFELFMAIPINRSIRNNNSLTLNVVKVLFCKLPLANLLDLGLLQNETKT